MKEKPEIKLVKIAKDLFIVSPYPALYIESEKTLVLADLHLGLEEEQEEKGVHIPIATFEKVAKIVSEPIKELNCSRLIFLGDVKHEFGRIAPREWIGVRELVSLVRKENCEPEVVRGNHDNFIITVLKRLNVKLYEPSIELGRFLLTHGHIEVNVNGKHLIIAHEHPVIAIKDDVGLKHRFKAFLDGEVHGQRITILPSVNPLAYGSVINELPSSELLSPLLKGKDLNNLTPYALIPRITLKKFPKLRFLALPQSY